MTRAPFTGPIRSVAGFEVGDASTITTVINEDAVVVAAIGDEDNPSTGYGYFTGSFAGSLAIAVSTEEITALPTVTAGLFRISYTTSGAVALTSTAGLLGTFDITT